MQGIKYYLVVIATTLTFIIGLTSMNLAQTDTLPSWNNGQVKESIIKFVTDVTTQGSSDFVPVAERIAVFDNDGTLWSEKPFYNQFAFIVDRVKEMAPQHPEWREQQPFKAILEGDKETLAASGMEGLLQLTMATHAGMTTAEFTEIVKDWIGKAQHPRFNRLYTQMVYQPMLELLTYLRSNGFKTYIVSGGGIDFMRPWTEKVYGIPPEQVIGSSIKTKFEIREGKPVLVRQAEIDFIDDKEGKPVGINKFIGRRPILAFGNSDGDLEMLQWTEVGDGSTMMAIIHHTDGEREWEYDRNSLVGKLDKALDIARSQGWLIVDMKKDWRQVFSFD
jgi:phosphoserine phosphatase